MTQTTNEILTSTHQTYLEDEQAIPTAHAIAAGVRSYRGEDDLPEDVAWAGRYGPGLLFTHVGPTGTIVHQVKPDTKPDDRDSKYIQASGVQALSIHPSRQRLVGAAKRILVVEGTKQALAASAHAPEDDLVVGIQGCNGWSHEGAPLPEMSLTTLGPGAEVLLAFDGDVATNPDVWTAASRLQEVLVLDGASAVRFVSIPGGTKAGLDDFLASRPAQSRAGVVATMLDSAKPRLPRKPAARKQASTASRAQMFTTVDEAASQIVRQTHDQDGTVRREVLLPAAIIIESTTAIHDDLNDAFAERVQIVHQVRVETAETTIHQASSVLLNRVPDSLLDLPRKLLNRIPSGEGAAIAPNPDIIGVDRMIGAAVRAYAAEERDYIQAVKRLGWVRAGEQWYYAYSGGAIGAHGATQRVVGHVGDDLSCVAFPDPSTISDRQLADDLLAMRRLCRTMTDPTVAVAGFGMVFGALAGMAPRGALGLVGEKGSGKTTAGRALSAVLSPRFADVAMASANATAGSIADAGKGAHNAPFLVDDFHPAQAEKAADSAVDALDALHRVSYGESRRSRLRADRETGEYEQKPGDRSQPHLLYTGEQALPAGTSGIERSLVIQFAAGTALTDDAVATIAEVGGSGALQRIAARFLQFEAARINGAGSVEAHVAVQGAERTSASITDYVSALGYPPLTPRTLEVATRMLVGWEIFERWAGMVCHDVDGSEYTGLMGMGGVAVAKIARLAGSHSARYLSQGSAKTDVLGLLRAVIDTRAARLAVTRDEDARFDDDRVPEIGKWAELTVDGEKIACLALITSAAARALSSFDTTRKWNEESLRTALAGAVVPDSSGRPERRLRFRSTTHSMLCIPKAVWQGEALPDADVFTERDATVVAWANASWAQHDEWEVEE